MPYPIGLQYQPVAGDGHCLYRAVSYYLFRNEGVMFLRNKVANRLEANPDLQAFVELREGQTIAEYIVAVRDRNVEANDLEIFTLMRILVSAQPIQVVSFPFPT